MFICMLFLFRAKTRRSFFLYDFFVSVKQISFLYFAWDFKTLKSLTHLLRNSSFENCR